MLSTFAAHGGLQVDLLDEVTYWIEQYWQHALIATFLIVEVCAELAGEDVATFAAVLAAERGIDVDAR